MPKRIQVGQDVIEFPDSMTDAQIEEVLKKQNPAEPETEKPEEYSVPGFVGNAVESGANLAKGLATMVAHPIDTAKNVGYMAAGTVSRMTDPFVPQQGHGPEMEKARSMSEGAQNYYTERLKHPIDTLYKDPVGAAADISTLASGTGGLLRAGSRLAKIASMADTSSALGKAADVAQTAARMTDPVRVPMALAGKAVKNVMENTGMPASAEALYESALKPPKGKTWPIEKGRKAVDTGLREGVVLKRGGIESLDSVRQKIDDINAEITSKIKAGAQSGATVDPAAVASRVDDLQGFFGNQVNPEADLASLAATKGEFLNNNSTTVQPPTPPWNPFTQGGTKPKPPAPVTTPTPIPIDKAQEMKQNTYAVNRKKYGELKGAEAEAQKALARGLKEEIAQQFPEISTLNARESSLLDLEDALESFLKRTGSRDPISLKGVISLPMILDNPMIRSKLAIAIYKARNPSSALGRARAVGSAVVPMVTPLSRISFVSEDQSGR